MLLLCWGFGVGTQCRDSVSKPSAGPGVEVVEADATVAAMTASPPTVPTVTLRNGVDIPAIGFGTWELRGDAAANATAAALAVGYRHIDTASMYGNEAQVGGAVKAAIADGEMTRRDVFVTTKIWNDDHGFDASGEALERSEANLGLGAIDLALIHWPGGSDRLETWRQMETQLGTGDVRSIGVSNYTVDDLDELATMSSITPMVNQIELNPFTYATQLPTLERCRQDGIQVTAWRPLTKGRALDHPPIAEVAQRADRTPAQVLLRWSIQHGVIPLPKTTSTDRMAENLAVFDFELSDDDMQALNAIS